MTPVLAYLATLVTFLVLDAVWLTRVMKPLFEAHVGDLLRAEPRLGVAAGFYAVYCAGIVYFASWPAQAAGSWWPAARDGAILGLLAYGTYEMTNMATLKGWHWRMVITDIAWGTALTAVSALAGYAVLASRNPA